MTEIPQNDNDDKQARMDKFIRYVLEGLNGSSGSVDVGDYSDGNDGKAPGISEREAEELARLFIDKGYHASFYYIDYPRHGFRWVKISKSVLHPHTANCSHTIIIG